MLFKSLQSIVSSSSNKNQIVSNQFSHDSQSVNGAALLDNLSLLSNNKKNQAAVLGKIVN